MPSKRGNPSINPQSVDTGVRGKRTAQRKPAHPEQDIIPLRPLDRQSDGGKSKERDRRDADLTDGAGELRTAVSKAEYRERSRWIVNLPFVAVSLAAILAISVAAYFLHAQRVAQQRAFFKAQAIEAEANGIWSDQADAWRDYLRLTPDDVDARARLATACDRAATTFKDKCRATTCYYFALGVQPDRIDLRQRLAELLVELRGFPLAEKEAAWLLEHDRRDPVGRRVLAACKYDRWRLDGKPVANTAAIIDVYNRALEVNPGDVLLSARLADIYWDELRFSSEAVREKLADAVMERMVQLNPQHADAYLARYCYRHNHHLPGKDQDQDLARALELAPDDVNVLVAVGNRSNEQERYREGRDKFRKVVELAPQDRRGHDGVGNSYRGEGDLQQAIDAWEAGLFYAGPDDVDLNAKIAEAQIELRRLDKAEEAVNRLARVANSLKPNVSRVFRTHVRGVVALLGAKLALASGDLMKAIDELRTAMTAQNVDNETDEDLAEQFQSLMRLGWTYGMLGQWDLAAKHFETAVTLMPQDSEARIALAGAWRSAGRLSLAIRQFRQALELNPANMVVTIALAECELQQQLTAPADHRNWEPFRRMLDQAKQQSPDAIRLQVLEAAFEETMGRSEHAIVFLEKAAAANPTSLRVAQTLVRAYQQAGNVAAADRVIAAYEKASGGPAWLLRAELRFQRQEPDEAKRILHEAIASADQSQRLAAIQRLDQSGLDAGERDALRQLLAQEADHAARPPLQLLQQLAEFALEARDSADLKHWEEMLHRLEGTDGSLWRYYRASRLLIEAATGEGPALVEATQLQAELEGLRPFWPQSNLLKGLIAQQHGRMELAAEAYQRAIELGENHLSTFENLITVLYRQNRFVDADHFLQRLGQLVSNSQSLSAVALAMATKNGQVERTLEIALEGVRKRPDDAMATVWLGIAQQVAGKPDEATVSFYRAVKMAPKDARTWTALAGFHAARKERKAAREAIDGLAKNVGVEGGKRSFVIAQGYELIGDRDQAEFNYREAVRQSPEDVVIQSQAAAYLLPTDPGTAELCLRRILSVAPHDAPARQKLAMMLVARGGEKNLREAADLLGDQSPDQLSPPQTKRLQTVLLLRRGDASSRRQAQAILESLIHEADELSADDRLILATLYEDQGRLAAAREQLAALANRHDPVPSHLAAYVDYLLRHASAKEAETPLARLQELEPESFRTVFLRAHFLAQQGKVGAVEPMIEEFSHKQLAKSDDAAVQAKLLKRIADLYAELGMTAAAERSYRQLAALSPEGQKPLAMWLVASGRRADAIRACSDAAAAGKSSEAAVALCAVLMGTETSVVDQSMVEGMLAASLREHPKDERLLFHVATLRCAQGRNAEAVELFRKLLSLNPRHVPAMNNLAALLAEDPASTAEAEAQIQKAIEIAGATAELLDTQAVVWMNQGKLSEAIAALREITTGAKVDPRHDFHLALACHRNGAEADARAALQRAESGGLGRQVLTPAERAQWAKLRDLLGVKHAERTPSAVKGGA